MRCIFAPLRVGAFPITGGAFSASTGTAQPATQEIDSNSPVSLDKAVVSIGLLGCR